MTERDRQGTDARAGGGGGAHTLIEYLEARLFFQEMDSYIEGHWEDHIFSKKNETNDYWLEAKASFNNEFRRTLRKTP